MKKRGEKMSIARTILDQIGGMNKVHAMTGCKFVETYDKNGVILTNLKRSKFNYVTIKLNVMDLYDVKFSKIVNYIVKTEKEINGIYCDQLKSIIEQETGLFLSL